MKYLIYSVHLFGAFGTLRPPNRRDLAEISADESAPVSRLEGKLEGSAALPAIPPASAPGRYHTQHCTPGSTAQPNLRCMANDGSLPSTTWLNGTRPRESMRLTAKPASSDA